MNVWETIKSSAGLSEVVMDTNLFNKIVQNLKQNFPNASHDFLLEKARQMHEAEMQRRSTLLQWEKSFLESRDIFDL